MTNRRPPSSRALQSRKLLAQLTPEQELRAKQAYVNELLNEQDFRAAVEEATLNLLPHAHVQVPLPSEYATRAVQRIYTVTTISAGPRYGGTRTPGMFLDFDDAVRTVLENVGDIYEGSYQLCVIEASVPGVYSTLIGEEYWFVWHGPWGQEPDVPDGGYKPCNKPSAWANMVAFGPG